MWYLMWCGFGVGKVEPLVSKFKNWMREEFILNIYKNDEWAPLWAAEDKAQRVHAMMVYWYKLQWHLNVACRGVKIGDFWLKQGKLKNSHKGRVVRKFRTRGCVVRKFRTRHYSPTLCKIEARSNGENFLLLRVGNVGWGRKRIFHGG